MDEDREQPLEELTTASSEAFENRVESVNGSLAMAQDKSSQDNCPQPCELGKFKTPQALLDAYNNLQAEFTKKCQRLSQLEKEKIDLQTPDESQIDGVCDQFLLTHAEAQGYAQDLKEKIRAGKTVTLQAFDDAWAAIVLDHIKSDASGGIVDKYVLSNENVRKFIIENYLDSLKNNAPPLTISTSGQRVAGSEPATPKTLGEAKKMVEKMFS